MTVLQHKMMTSAVFMKKQLDMELENNLLLNAGIKNSKMYIFKIWIIQNMMKKLKYGSVT